MSESFSFVVEAREGEARACAYSTPHGIIPTPCFMPVGTQASVKGVLPQTLADSGASIILANTYHLLLRPRLPVLEKVGGVRAFMRWQGALLTDSGGFQALSLGELVKVEEGGIVFRSHIDGTRLNLTPELAMRAQRVFDSTIAMALDECVPSTSPVPRLREAVERSALWGERSLAYWRNEALSKPTLSKPTLSKPTLSWRACALWDCARRFRPLAQTPVGRAHARARLRRLRARRICRRRKSPRTQRRAGTSSPATTARTASIPDGRRKAARPYRSRRLWHRPLRLRLAHA